jgi:hypothetical protein
VAYTLRVSPSSLKRWETDPADWVRRYICEQKDEKTVPMMIGTMFDDIVKEDLARKFGVGTGVKFPEEVPQWVVDEATPKARAAWEYYQKCGAYASMCAGHVPKDLSLEGRLECVLDCGAVCLGFNDAMWVDGNGRAWVHDWKVSGWKSGRSVERPAARVWGHRDYSGSGVLANSGLPARESQGMPVEWFDQLCFYMLMKGHESGVGQIDMITGPPDRIKVARHIREIGPADVDAVRERVCRMWKHITEEWYWPTVSRETSKRMLEELLGDTMTVVESGR